jgi:hypothetical protein
VVLKLQSAFSSSGLERNASPNEAKSAKKRKNSEAAEASKCVWLERARADWIRAWWSLASSMVVWKLESAVGSSGLERIGVEHCRIEAPKCSWLERARADPLSGIYTYLCTYVSGYVQ